jgi:hypothetical protein
LSARRIFLVVAALCGALLCAPTSAVAASPWMPFHAADFDLAAGTRCPFALSGRVLFDEERIRTTQTNPDGTPSQQEVRGPLVVRYINVDTRASVVRNLTGDALFDTRADGSSTITLLHGHLAVGLAATDPGGPAFLVLRGRGFSIDFAADGRRTVTIGTGRVENICQTLA